MAEFRFENLSFTEEKEEVIVHFLKVYKTTISKDDLQAIGDFKIEKNAIIFKDVSDKKAQNGFNSILAESFQNLVSIITKKPVVYIHRNSGIPLIDNVSFGIVDRNTNLIEIKPSTGCNIDCIYCSVNQEKRPIDFVVEEEYMVEELVRLIEEKRCSNIEVHIGTQGEPLLYAPLADLIRDISNIPEVKRISMDTNGTMISKEKADELIKAGLTQFNLSINAFNDELAKKIGGPCYNLNHVKELAEYIAQRKAGLILTPVWIPGINDSEMEILIQFAKRLHCRIGIQNFLNYRFGKNPAKEMHWEKFYDKLKVWEKEYDIHLILDEKDFGIEKTRPLEKPFEEGDVLTAKLICEGRLPGEMIAVAKGRTITVSECKEKRHRDIKVRITGDKHNIFYAAVAK